MKLDILFVNFTKDPPKLTAVSTCKHADLLRTYVLSHTSICEMYLEENTFFLISHIQTYIFQGTMLHT